MTGTHSSDYALEYEARQRRRFGPLRDLGGPPLRSLAAFLITIALIYLGAQLLNIGPGSDPNGSILSASGCIPMNVEPVNVEPTLALEEAEEAARAQIAGRGLTGDIGDHIAEPFEPGEIYWAKYGSLSQPARGLSPGPRSESRSWVLIFEDERDDPWYSHLWRRPSGPRFTAVYSPEQERITRYCGGYS